MFEEIHKDILKIFSENFDSLFEGVLLCSIAMLLALFSPLKLPL